MNGVETIEHSPTVIAAPTYCCPAGAFLALAVLFFKDAGGGQDAPHQASMVSNALQQLQGNRGLRAVLMIVGILLITYGEAGHIIKITAR
jgi:hypothetical protein